MLNKTSFTLFNSNNIDINLVITRNILHPVCKVLLLLSVDWIYDGAQLKQVAIILVPSPLVKPMVNGHKKCDYLVHFENIHCPCHQLSPWKILQHHWDCQPHCSPDFLRWEQRKSDFGEEQPSHQAYLKWFGLCWIILRKKRNMWIR